MIFLGDIIVNEKKFLKDLIEIMDTEKEISLNTTLAEIEEWDSLSQISFMSYIARYAKNTKITPMDIKKAITVRNLYDFICRE